MMPESSSEKSPENGEQAKLDSPDVEFDEDVWDGEELSEVDEERLELDEERLELDKQLELESASDSAKGSTMIGCIIE